MVVIAGVDRDNRARDVVATAEKIAEAFEEPIHVVHALSRAEFVNLEQRSVDARGRGVEIDDVRAFAAGVASDAIAESEPIVSVEAVGLVGRPASQLVSYATSVDASFIVLAPTQRSPVGKAVFGSTAQSVILNATSPVVSVPQI